MQIYSSFLFRVPPTRNYGTLSGDEQLENFLKDADLDGRSFDNIIREMQINASIYGTCWAIMDKPAVQTETRAEEIKTLATYKHKMDRLLFTEDFPQELRYKRPIKWEPEPIIKDVDVLDLFEQSSSN